MLQLIKLSAGFLPIVFRPAYPRVIEFLVLEESFRWLPSSSALDPLEGVLVFQIWRECRPRFGDTNLAKKKLTLALFFSGKID